MTLLKHAPIPQAYSKQRNDQYHNEDNFNLILSMKRVGKNAFLLFFFPSKKNQCSSGTKPVFHKQFLLEEC